MKGTDYIAQVELTNKDGDVVAVVGERCDRVDPKSLGWLADQGLIVLEAAGGDEPKRVRRNGKGA